MRSGSRFSSSASRPRKSPLSSLTAKPRPGLPRRVVRRDVRAPDAVALLEPAGVDRPVAAGDEPVLPARLPRSRPRAGGRTRSGSRAPSRARRRRSRGARGTAPGRRRALARRMYGKSSGRRPSGSRMSRERGPQIPRQASCEVTSSTRTEPSSGACDGIQARSWRPNAVPVTIRKRSSARRVTVKSHSIPPRSFSIDV